VIKFKFGIQMLKPGLASLAMVLFFLSIAGTVAARSDQLDGPYYVIQPGDSLWDIAVRFKVSLDELEKANGISDPNQLAVGGQLIIPGLEGVKGRVDTRTVAFGETLRSLSRNYRVPVETLTRVNRLTSPAELYAGADLIVPISDIDTQPAWGRAELLSEQSLLELAVLRGVNPWSFSSDNGLSANWSALPGDVLRLPQTDLPGEQNILPGALPEAITSATIEPLMPKQGKTVEIKISAPEGLTINGSLIGYDLHFFRYQDGYVALQGIPAMLAPGLYPLALEGQLPGSEPFAFSQAILVRDAGYPYDPVLKVDPETVDPAVTVPESELWAKLGVPATPEKMWDGQFASPVSPEFSDCWTSRFGSRRAYNGGTYDFFHGGLDFCGGIGTKLFAVAPGKVVFTGLLTVRGNVTVIDHGWGVYTAYDHQSEILVKPGDQVVAGQVIGLGGDTGRTTGPHLHFEVWAGDVQIDPVDWLQRAYP